MKEQFVTYEIAVKLKELGFNEECLAGFLPKFSLNDCGINWNVKDLNDINDLDCSAPLWQQAIDWLFNKYGFIVYYSNNDWSLVTKNESFLYNEFPNSTVFQKWEKAILKAIELIKL